MIGNQARLKAALREFAPSLAGAVGGPLAAQATRTVSRALFGNDAADPDSLARAVESAGPEALERLAMAELAFKEARLAAAAGDRADARARERALQDRLPGALALLVVGGFFAVLCVMLSSRIPSGMETEFSIMLGALATMAASVMNYYFGSSAGSRDKTELLTGRGLQGSGREL